MECVRLKVQTHHTSCSSGGWWWRLQHSLGLTFQRLWIFSTQRRIDCSSSSAFIADDGSVGVVCYSVLCTPTLTPTIHPADINIPMTLSNNPSTQLHESGQTNAILHNQYLRKTQCTDLGLNTPQPPTHHPLSNLPCPLECLLTAEAVYSVSSWLRIDRRAHCSEAEKDNRQGHLGKCR